MPLTADTIDRLAGELYDAERNRTTVAKVVERHPDLTFEDAYAIGERVAARYRDGGSRQVGWKLANSRLPYPRNAQLARPVRGPIFDHNVRDESEPLRIGELIDPRVEPEICFLLDRDLAGPGVTVPEVLAATRGVLPAYEIVDTRQTWDGDLRNIIADNVFHARLIVGATLIPADAVDLRYVGCVLERNGEILGTGAGAVVLGHPARAVALLANELGEAGDRLRAGDLITTGSVIPPAAMAAGDVFTATYGGLGRITLRVVE